MAAFTLHILDVTSGKMAEGVLVQKRKIVDGDWQQLPDATTDADGEAVLSDAGGTEAGGYYEVLVFLGAYFDQTGRDLPPIKMVDIVPLRFGLEPDVGKIDIHMSITPHGYTAAFAS